MIVKLEPIDKATGDADMAEFQTIARDVQPAQDIAGQLHDLGIGGSSMAAKQFNAELRMLAVAPASGSLIAKDRPHVLKTQRQRQLLVMIEVEATDRRGILRAQAEVALVQARRTGSATTPAQSWPGRDRCAQGWADRRAGSPPAPETRRAGLSAIAAAGRLLAKGRAYRASVQFVSSSYYHCPGALIGEQLAQQHMRLATIDDMHARDSGQGIQAGRDFGDHAAGNNALFDQLPGLFLAQFRDQRAIGATDAGDVAQEDQFLCVERARQVRRYQVGIDIEAGSILIRAEWGHDWNIALLDERLHGSGINGVDLTNEAQALIGNVGADHIAIGAAQSDGLAPQLRRHQHEALIDLAEQHHAHDLQRLSIGDAQAVLEMRRDIELPQPFIDIGAAAVHQHGMRAERMQPDDILQNVALVLKRAAAELYHQRLALQVFDI